MAVAYINAVNTQICLSAIINSSRNDVYVLRINDNAYIKYAGGGAK